MYTIGILGCGVLLFGPYIEACALCLAVGRPQLVLCALLAATLALAPSVLSSLLYACLPQRWRWSSSASAPLASSLALLLVHNGLVYAVRLLACWCAWRVQAWLRDEYQQVFVYSRFRLAPVSLALGLGFGFTSAVLLGGSLWLDAALQTRSSVRGVSAYNIDVCPQLPTLLHAALQSFLLTGCHAAWGVMAGQSVAAIQAVGPRAFRQLLRPARGAHPSVEGADGDGLFRSAMPEDVVPSSPATAKGTATNVNAHNRASTAAAGPRVQGALPGTTIIPADTRLVDHPKVVCVTLVAVAVLQVVFALLPLFHGAALDLVAGTERASRGCVVSLPLQLVTTAISVLYALWLMHVERMKLD